MGEALHYRHDSLDLVGQLFRPTGTPNGRAMLVLHEADGIGSNVLRRCVQLAEMGYVALAPDLHGGGEVLAGDAMMAAVQTFRADPQLFRSRVQAGLDALFEASGIEARQTAAMGYCFGGMAALELARSGTPIAAAASFHGLLTTAAPAAPGAIQARILACTGAKDPLVPLGDITAFQKEMYAAQADWQLIVYGTALHSFTNANVDGMDDPRMRYDASADRQSWQALLAFLEESFA